MSRDDDERYISIFASMTAMISEICELLIESNAIDRTELYNRLCELRQKAPNQHAAGPITHLIKIIESPEIDVPPRERRPS